MNTFTEIYLTGLQQGMAKQASLMDTIKDFKPLAAGNEAITGTAAGAAGGAILGGVGNALLGSSQRDPRTGEKRNGIAARLLKGGLAGAAGGAAAGYLGQDTIAAAGRGGVAGAVAGEYARKFSPGVRSIVPDVVRDAALAHASRQVAENTTMDQMWDRVTGRADWADKSLFRDIKSNYADKARGVLGLGAKKVVEGGKDVASAAADAAKEEALRQKEELLKKAK